MLKKNAVIGRVALIIAIVIVVNMISETLYLRLDFTADKRYTLSDATYDILEELDDVITISAYFTEDLPPQLQSTRQDFQDLLVEYETRSDGNIVFEFINPNESEETEANAQQQGIGPLIVNVRESDQVQQLRAYMGATLQLGDQTEVIPVVQPGAAMEYALSTSIKKLSVLEKPKIAVLQGHGEATFSAIPQLGQQLSVLYDLEPYSLTDTTLIPNFYRALIVLNPTDTFPASHLNQIDQFIGAGGNVFVAYSNLQGDLNRAYLSPAPDIGISGWLAQKGIVLGNQFVTDATSASISVRQQQGPFVINTQVQFPYFPIISKFADHVSSKGLESLVLPFVSPLIIQSQDSTITITPIAFSSDQSGLVGAPTTIDINKRWTERDFNQGSQPVAVAIEGNLQGSQSAKMIIVSNGSFAVNGEPPQQQQLNADNINFASNAIDWLADDTGLIDLRTKGVTSRPLDTIEDSTKSILKYGNVLAPILLILLYAFVRRQQFVRKKQKWFQGNY